MPGAGDRPRSEPTVDRGAMTVAQAFEALELAPTADRGKVRAAFRRLAFAYHPDRNRGNPRSVERFQRLTRAYEVLESMFVLEAEDGTSGDASPGECEYCGTYTILSKAMDGARCCSECLILARGHRRLPAPAVVVVSCGITIVILTLAVAFLVMAVVRHPGYGLAALVAGLLSNLSLAVTCLTVVYTARPDDLSKTR